MFMKQSDIPTKMQSTRMINGSYRDHYSLPSTSNEHWDDHHEEDDISLDKKSDNLHSIEWNDNLCTTVEEVYTEKIHDECHHALHEKRAPSNIDRIFREECFSCLGDVFDDRLGVHRFVLSSWLYHTFGFMTKMRYFFALILLFFHLGYTLGTCSGGGMVDARFETSSRSDEYSRAILPRTSPWNGRHSSGVHV